MRDFEKHDQRWREPSQVIGGWEDASLGATSLLTCQVRGRWWETVEATGGALIVTRETEHLVVSLRVVDGVPDISYVRLPHPSGIAVDMARRVVHIASTRNPNQIFDFEPAVAEAGRSDVRVTNSSAPVLMPTRSRFLPGSLYLHDLAIVDGSLHANAVGENAIVLLDGVSGYRRVWWPRVIDSQGPPRFGANHLQLNSIAAGPTLDGSFFTASTDRITRRRPGHLDFKVDQQGVLFSGRSREAEVRGLTRPHSARWHDGQVWVDDSGYGTFGPCSGGRLRSLTRLPGWTRGLAFVGRVAFVGTSRIIPRYRHYAPGVNVEQSICGVHAVDVRSGDVLGRIEWPSGNQIFAIEPVPAEIAGGFPFVAGSRSRRRNRDLFYSYSPSTTDRDSGTGPTDPVSRRPQ